MKKVKIEFQVPDDTQIEPKAYPGYDYPGYTLWVKQQIRQVLSLALNTKIKVELINEV